MPQQAPPAPGLGEFIRTTREGLGLTTAQLGDAIGVHQTTISRWELGRNLGPVAHHAPDLANALGAEVEVIHRLWWEAKGGYLAAAA